MPKFAKNSREIGNCAVFYTGKPILTHRFYPKISKFCQILSNFVRNFWDFSQIWQSRKNFVKIAKNLVKNHKFWPRETYSSAGGGFGNMIQTHRFIPENPEKCRKIAILASGNPYKQRGHYREIYSYRWVCISRTTFANFGNFGNFEILTKTTECSTLGAVHFFKSQKFREKKKKKNFWKFLTWKMRTGAKVESDFFKKSIFGGGGVYIRRLGGEGARRFFPHITTSSL